MRSMLEETFSFNAPLVQMATDFEIKVMERIVE